MRIKLFGIILLLFVINSIAAQERSAITKEKPIEKNETKDQVVASSMPVFAALTLNIGMTYPTGDIAGDGGQGSLIGLAYGFTCEGGYKFTHKHAVIGNLGFSANDLKTEATFMGTKQTSTITARHIDCGVGYRYFFNVFYIESGLVFGIPAGTWTKTSELNGSETETDIDESKCKMKLGFFGGFGYTRPINGFLYFQASVRLNISFLPVYDDGDTVLRDNNLILLCGVGHNF